MSTYCCGQLQKTPKIQINKTTKLYRKSKPENILANQSFECTTANTYTIKLHQDGIRSLFQ